MIDSRSLWLNDDELAEFTGFQWRTKQRMALAQMAIPFKVNPRGRILVMRADVGLDKPKSRKRVEPDWNALPKPKNRG